MTNHPDPGFGGVCPRPEGGAYCTICGLCLDHCQCNRASLTDINEFRRKTRALEENAWFCGCGDGCTWILHENGDCVCAACHCISTVIRVVRTSETAK